MSAPTLPDLHTLLGEHPELDDLRQPDFPDGGGPSGDGSPPKRCAIPVLGTISGFVIVGDGPPEMRERLEQMLAAMFARPCGELATWIAHVGCPVHPDETMQHYVCNQHHDHLEAQREFLTTDNEAGPGVRLTMEPIGDLS